MPAISWLATLVASVLAFAVGAVWYGPLFGKAWMAEQGLTPEKLREGFDPARTYGITAALTALSALVFGIFLGLMGAHSAMFAVGFGFSVGLFFAAFSVATHQLFERGTPRLFLIHAGYHSVRFALMGAAFGWLG